MGVETDHLPVIPTLVTIRPCQQRFRLVQELHRHSLTSHHISGLSHTCDQDVVFGLRDRLGLDVERYLRGTRC